MRIFRVLIVEDLEKDANYFRDVLEKVLPEQIADRGIEKVEAEIVTNQEDADKAVLDTEFDLVLLDLRYPEVPDGPLGEDVDAEFQGMKWLPSLRRAQPRATVVILTSFAYSNDLGTAVQAVRDCQAHDVIPKNISIHGLVARIMSAQEHATRLEEPCRGEKSPSRDDPEHPGLVRTFSSEAVPVVSEPASIARLPSSGVDVVLQFVGPINQSLIQSLDNGEDGNGEARLKMIIQSFFPNARHAGVEIVGGGWSGTGLACLHVEGEEDSYYLKFFRSRAEYDKELVQHQSALKWLGDATVKIRPVPEILESICQSEAFPNAERNVYPVCYNSASTRSRTRVTLKDFYRRAKEKDLAQGLNRLLLVLGTGQASSAPNSGESAFGPRGFGLSHELKAGLLDALEDLSMYAEQRWEDWSQRQPPLQHLIHDLPPWLTDWTPVVRGHIHGDPNPRNCLIACDNPDDLLLIDCGDYTKAGRLVSDLAVIERDIKLVMMGLEREAGEFFDLDVRQLNDWCNAETHALRHGMDYTLSKAWPRGSSHCSATRAHPLVGIVRQRAKELCSDWDPEGKHYFAALLYWTLEILQYPAVRRTKKLLALYSASEILQAMQQK